MIRLLPVLLLAALVVAFTPPDAARRHAAAEPLSNVGPAERRAFSNHGEFQAKREPGAMDWLASRKEPGQTYIQFLRSRPNLPEGRRRVLYILPLGTFGEDQAPSLETLQAYASHFFHPLEVRLIKPVPADRVRAKSRVHGGNEQWNTKDILAWMKAKLPADAYAMLAVTMTDLYPDDSWNFVFGQASYRERVGVFSFARYHPAFSGDEGGPDTGRKVLERSAKVLTHEMGHMFGIRHCIHYECLMNGANHLAEADATPLHLCPVCLRKLAHACRFDPAKRYTELEGFYEKNGFNEQAAWAKKRRIRIEAAAR